MRRPRLGLVVLVALLAFGASVSVALAAHAKGWRDDFSTLDTSRWLVSSRPFGWGILTSANVTVANGQLGIAHPAGTLDGGELRTRSLYQYGTYRAHLKIANAPSSLTAFFLYRAPDYEQEIDIEIYDDSTGRVMFSTYSGGAQTNTVTKTMPFDPTAAFHDYTIEYERSSVRFLVDGTLMQSWTRGVPRASMYVYLNSWFPSWLAGQAPDSDRTTSADWIDYTP
jgi:endo-1,3-1,4-beta-glycanase ExoK